MEQPQEPAWLRNYKTRVAPFSAGTAKAPVQTLPSPPPAQVQALPNEHDEQPDSSVPRQHNTLSIHFPSTMSLGLKSFGQPANSEPDSSKQPPIPEPESFIHPALRGGSNGSTGNEGTSDSSSTRTRVDMGYKAHHYEKVGDKHDTGWKMILKGWMRRLGCH